MKKKMKSMVCSMCRKLFRSAPCSEETIIVNITIVMKTTSRCKNFRKRLLSHRNKRAYVKEDEKKPNENLV